METPDLNKFSLILLHDGNAVFTSTDERLQPLFDCVARYRGQLSKCTLYDRTIGLAAARLIVFSEMISSVVTRVASLPAKELLQRFNIPLVAERTVENILNKDKSDICPMEKRALVTDDNGDFFKELEHLFVDK
ncbi:MAG: hypothetical protein Kow0090_05530 [Myxococcota bacterium]